jgi:hypothetical protein
LREATASPAPGGEGDDDDGACTCNGGGGDSLEFTDAERTIARTREFNVPNNHLIKVTACWRSMSSTEPTMVTLSITDEENVHKQEQNHRIDTSGVGQAGGEMSKVLKVLANEGQGDITPGPHRFKLRAVRVGSSDGDIVIQADKTYPVEILVEDLGVTPPQL